MNTSGNQLLYLQHVNICSEINIFLFQELAGIVNCSSHTFLYDTVTATDMFYTGTVIYLDGSCYSDNPTNTYYIHVYIYVPRLAYFSYHTDWSE